MARTASFDDLVQAIQDSFLKVNQISGQQHLDMLAEYFDEENKPVCVKMDYPVRREDGSLSYTEVEIPKISLVPITSLKLKEVKVDFRVKLAGKVKLRSAAVSNGLPESGQTQEEKNYVGYLPHASGRDKSGYADICLKFESEEPPEGILRIRDTMIRIIP